MQPTVPTVGRRPIPYNFDEHFKMYNFAVLILTEWMDTEQTMRPLPTDGSVLLPLWADISATPISAAQGLVEVLEYGDVTVTRLQQAFDTIAMVVSRDWIVYIWQQQFHAALGKEQVALKNTLDKWPVLLLLPILNNLYINIRLQADQTTQP